MDPDLGTAIPKIALGQGSKCHVSSPGQENPGKVQFSKPNIHTGLMTQRRIRGH